MQARLKPAILGATGYAGAELTRILLRHPSVSTPLLLRHETGQRGPTTLAEAVPAFAGNGGYPLQPFSWTALHQQGVDLLFLSTPHQVSRELVPEVIARGIRVIDLSAAWRLKEAQHRAIYSFSDADSATAAELTQRAIFGLPELHGDQIPGAALVANPGCYSTSIILALAPLLKAGLIERERGIIADSKSGVSGAGKDPTARTHFVSVADNLSAYAVFAHRHSGEILEQLALTSAELIFTPHLLPIPRGILSTLYVYLNRPTEAADIETCFRDFYAGKPWVRVFSAPQLPEIQFCLHTNYCDLGYCVAEDRRRLVLVSCIDNLVKGAAGQAVQNMNLMFGLKETEGLQ
ncbi:MAG TPA: N-acetyl-gamma-glutamyl-phosphate reductase [Terriglobales bacterium]|nr:N-acetyl-gamma-glutamyl-phosphate reductase [Terriglobales bacterium]